MKVSIGCDHGGYDLKEEIKKHLIERGIEVVDVGCDRKERCDYPIYGREAALAVADGTCDRGIVVCTTGIGISIAANKVKGVRCALCTDPYLAKMTRLHNDANMLAMGAALIGINMAKEITDTFLDTPFSGDERHQKRIDLIEG